MNTSTVNLLTSKWVTILQEYEKVKIGQSTNFKTVDNSVKLIMFTVKISVHTMSDG